MPAFSFSQNSKPRFYSGVLFALLGATLTFSYLETLFSAVGMPLATVALFILAIGAACIGMCLGVLLPLVIPGVCFGASFAILIGIFMPNNTMLCMHYFCPAMALLGGLLSIK